MAPGKDSEVDDVSDAAELVRSHPATNAEIRLLCGDLQVLGRSEFKQLLKWRLTLKKDLLKAAGKKKEATDAVVEVESDEEEREEPKDKATQLEDQLLDEMEEIKDRLDRKKKREKRRRKELKNKSRVRAAQLAQAEGIGEEIGPDGLFSLAGIRSKREVSGVADVDAPSDEDLGATSSDEDRDSEESDIDSDEERLRYDAAMDEYLEESYRSWKVRQRTKDAGGGVVKKRRRRLGMDGELDEEERSGSGSESEEVSEEEESEEESEDGNGLIVSLDENRIGKAASAAAAANQWFSQDLFDDANLEDDDEDEEDEDQPPAKRRQQALGVKAPRPVPAGNSSSDEEEEEEEDGEKDASGSEEEEEEGQKKVKKSTKNKQKANGYGFGPADKIIPNPPKESEGFEVVPMSDSDQGSDSEDEFEGLDDEAKAEVRALAKKFLRKKSKDDIMEAAYNRYAL